MVFCFEKNCELDTVKKNIVLVIKKKICKFEAKGKEFAKNLRSLEQSKVSKI